MYFIARMETFNFRCVPPQWQQCSEKEQLTQIGMKQHVSTMKTIRQDGGKAAINSVVCINDSCWQRKVVSWCFLCPLKPISMSCLQMVFRQCMLSVSWQGCRCGLKCWYYYFRIYKKMPYRYSEVKANTPVTLIIQPLNRNKHTHICFSAMMRTWHWPLLFYTELVIYICIVHPYNEL